MAQDATDMQARMARTHGIELTPADAARMAAQAADAAALLHRLSQEARAQGGPGMFFGLLLRAHADVFAAALEDGQDG